MPNSNEPSAHAGEPPQRASWLRSAWCMAVALAVTAFGLFTRHNDFPYQYHPDEHTKAAQIIEGNRNLRHPLLLLNSAALAASALPEPRTAQDVSRAGRFVSATFAACAVAALALVGRRLAGAACGWLAGLAVLLNPQLLELAHYFKEDTALLFGWSLTALALLRLSGECTAGRVAFAGAAVALAGSAKYLGLLALPVAIAVLIFAVRRSKSGGGLRAAGVFAAAFVAVFTVVNIHLLLDFNQLRASLDYEMYHVRHGQKGVAESAPLLRYWESLPRVFGWPVLVGALLATAVCTMPRWRRFWPLAVFPWLYSGVLALSPKIAPRYLLPATGAACVLAAFGVAVLAGFIRDQRWRNAALAVLGGALVLGCIPQFRATASAFKKDSRRELATWLVANTPPSGGILFETKAAIGWIALPGLEKLKLTRNDIAADAGTLDELRARGIRYVVVHGTNRSFYTAKNFAPSADVREQFERRRAFYTALAETAAVPWKSKQGDIAYMMPDLRVYDLAKPK